MDALLDALTMWIPRQRWFAGKDRRPRFEFVGEWAVPGAPGRRVLLIADDSTTPREIYQVPVAYLRGQRTPGAILTDDEGSYVDGVRDDTFARALLRMVLTEATADAHDSTSSTWARGRRIRGGPEVEEPASTRVLDAEQSNTSIVYEGSGLPVICKIFRRVTAGINPEVEVQGTLSADGTGHVPTAVGSLEGGWGDHANQHGSFAFVQEFLPGAVDGWDLALQDARRDVDFTEAAHGLGAATARVHRTLRRAFPTRHATGQDRERVRISWMRRLEQCLQHFPDLTPVAPTIESEFDRAIEADWSPLQRVHGDLHLGQAIRSSDGRWLLLDFEGEPLRPVSERRAVDLPLRDVAGMLRSLDYAAAAVRREDPTAGRPSAEWASRARDAFLDAYTGNDGRSTAPALLRALELDKALYEASYEARNRPSWADIPREAILRLARTPV